MIGHTSYPVRAFGPDSFLLKGSFQCNASSNPSSTTFRNDRGMTFTVAYAATGVYTVTLGTGLSWPAQPMAIGASAQYATLATDWFEVGIVGDTTLTTVATPSFVIQAHRNGTAREPANTAGNRINFWVGISNNTGK